MIAPGYVDVSGLNFTATGGRSSYLTSLDDDNAGIAKGGGNSTLKNTIVDDDNDSRSGGGGRSRSLDDATLQSTTVRRNLNL